MFQVGGGGRECPFWEDFKNYYSSGRGEALPRSPLGKCSISAPQTPNPVACVPRMGASVGLKTYPLVGGRNLPTYYPDLEKEKKHRSRAGKKKQKRKKKEKHRSQVVEKHPPCLWVMGFVCGNQPQCNDEDALEEHYKGWVHLLWIVTYYEHLF